MRRQSRAATERAVYLQGRGRQAKHRAGRPRQVRRVGEPGRMRCARQGLALHQQRPDMQEPSPQQVRAQGHAGLFDEQVPKAPRRQVRGLRNLAQRNSVARPLADVLHRRQHTRVRWPRQGGSGNVVHQFKARGNDRIMVPFNAPGRGQAPGSGCNKVGIEQLKPALQPCAKSSAFGCLRLDEQHSAPLAVIDVNAVGCSGGNQRCRAGLPLASPAELDAQSCRRAYCQLYGVMRMGRNGRAPVPTFADEPAPPRPGDKVASVAVESWSVQGKFPEFQSSSLPILAQRSSLKKPMALVGDNFAPLRLCCLWLAHCCEDEGAAWQQ